MGQIDALLQRLTAKPTPADFRYSSLCRIMAHFGYVESNKGTTSGSRVKFYNRQTGAAIMLHKPHPRDIMSKSAVDDVVKFLKREGHI